MNGDVIGVIDHLPDASSGIKVDRRTILVVCTEWTPKHGGLSSFNQKLCSELGRAGHTVYCYIPREDSGEGTGPVRLVYPPATPGLSDDDSVLFRRPDLPGGIEPTIIIGHDTRTGPYALALRDDYFRAAKVVVIMHVSYFDLEYHKHNGGGGQAEASARKHESQKETLSAADLIVGVGPRLHYNAQVALYEMRETGRLVRCISEPLQFDPGLCPLDRKLFQVKRMRHEVYMFTRTEHLHQKGIDMAAEAMGRVCAMTEMEVVFAVRGCDSSNETSIREDLEGRAANSNLTIQLKLFDANHMTIRADLARASLVLMPSREEGFGLAAWEAIEAGVPVLVSRKTGLADLLYNNVNADIARIFVVDNWDSVSEWARRIGNVLLNLDVAIEATLGLRDILAPRYTWEKSIEQLEAAWSRFLPEG